MPELGKYSVEVLSAYGVSIVLLAGIVLLSWVQARRARAELAKLEGNKNG